MCRFPEEVQTDRTANPGTAGEAEPRRKHTGIHSEGKGGYKVYTLRTEA